MSRYYTQEDKDRANAADIVGLLERSGIYPSYNRGEYIWKNNGHEIYIKDNLWFDHYDQVGGKTVSFVKKYFDRDFKDAMEFILGNYGLDPIRMPANRRSLRSKPFMLPKRNNDYRRIFAYLCIDRGLNSDIVHEFVHNGSLYESADHHNVVFVGYDAGGNARHAHLRSTLSNSKWRANVPSSDNRHTFRWRGGSNRLFLFEAPIDMLSYIQMHSNDWMQHTYIAACSTADISLMEELRNNSNIEQIYICFDNDGPGQKAALQLRDKLQSRDYSAEILVPTHKDWNEDLINLRQEEGEAECPVSQFLLL